MKIQIEYRANYGCTLAYPACAVSKTLAKLIGTKTFTNDKLKVIQELGYDIEANVDKPRVPYGLNVTFKQ